MNLFRIVRKRANKREYQDSPIGIAGTVLLFVFLLPYVVSCLWGHVGEETEIFSGKKETKQDWIDGKYEICIAADWGSRKISMHEYLVQKLEIVLPKEDDNGVCYELETLKAQAVLLRTELWSLFLARDGSLTLQDDILMYYEKEKSADEERTVYEKAVEDTDGIFLAYGKEPVKAAFFPVSNGHTRDASEVWTENKYPYLTSVECSRDILSKDYVSQVLIEKKEYCRKIKELFVPDAGGWEMEELSALDADIWEKLELTYDSAGYVTEVSFKEYSCSGEAFRNQFALDSASFEPQWQEESVVFHVKGVGHGFGMSQYGANKKAEDGETFNQILEDYFLQTELVKIE